MKELLTMWKSTQMIVLTVLIAAVYAAVIVPFKAIPLVPGFTEIRVAPILIPAASLLFGPAAAWGAAVGNLIADLFGTFGPGSLVGFVGNFFFGAVPYVLWGRLGPLSSGEEPSMTSPRQILEFCLLVGVAGLANAAILGWGLELLRFFPFTVLGTIVAINNVLVPVLLGWLLLRLLYGRVSRMGLLWTDVMRPEEIGGGRSDGAASTGARIGTHILALSGTAAMVVGALGGWFTGMALSLGAGGRLGLPGFGQTGGDTSVIAGVAPFMLLLLLALLLCRSRPELFGSGGSRAAPKGGSP